LLRVADRDARAAQHMQQRRWGGGGVGPASGPQALPMPAVALVLFCIYGGQSIFGIYTTKTDNNLELHLRDRRF
jgi:hypothetical protein